VEQVELPDGRTHVVPVVAERGLLPRLRIAILEERLPLIEAGERFRFRTARSLLGHAEAPFPLPARDRLGTAIHGLPTAAPSLVTSLRNGRLGVEAAWAAALRPLSDGGRDLSRSGHLVEDRRPALRVVERPVRLDDEATIVGVVLLEPIVKIPEAIVRDR